MKINLFRGFLSILSAKVGTLLLTVIFTPILVRLLGSSQYGVYTFVLSLLGVTMILVNAGINDGIRKFVAEDRAASNWANDVFGFYTRLGISLSGFATIIFAAANKTGLTAALIGAKFEHYIYLIIILLFTRNFFSIIRSSLMGKGLENLSEPLTIVKKAIFSIVGLFLVYLGYGVTGVLVGHIVASILATGIGLYFVSSKYDLLSVIRIAPSGFPRRKLVSFNTHSIIFLLLNSSLFYTDILLLQPLAGSSAVGYYKAALVIAEFLWFVPGALQTMLLHSTSEIWARKKSSEITEIASRTTRYALVITLLLIIGIAALADPFVPFYFGNDFTPSIVPLLLLLPGALGFALSRPLYAIGQGKGDLQPLIVATGSAAIINLVLNISLIPAHGMAGAAIATSIGYGSMLAFHGFIAFRIGYNPFADLRLRRIVVTVAAAAPVIFGLSHLIKSELISLLIIPPLGFAVYSIAALRTQAVSPVEILPFIEHTPSPLSEWLIRVIQRIK